MRASLWCERVVLTWLASFVGVGRGLCGSSFVVVVFLSMDSIPGNAVFMVRY